MAETRARADRILEASVNTGEAPAPDFSPYRKQGW